MPARMSEPAPAMLPFLAAVRSAPADDLPRLVFADWLEENGYGTWAELIRVQCDLARAPCQVMRAVVQYGHDRRYCRAVAADPDDLRLLDLIDREKACLRRQRELPAFRTAADVEQVEFDRGLPTVSWTFGPPPAAAVAAIPDQCWAWVDTLHIGGAPAAIPDLAPVLGRPMRWSHSQGDLDDRTPVPLDRWRKIPALNRLRHLRLALNRQPDPRAAFLDVTRWPLASLENLTLFLHCDFDARMAVRLTAARWPRLSELTVRTNGVPTDLYVRIADTLGLRRLELNADWTADVFLAQCRNGLLQDAGGLPPAGDMAACVRALATSPTAVDMTYLGGPSPAFGDDELRQLLASPHLRHVHVLSLDYSGVTDDGMVALTRSPMLGRLRQLSFSHTAVGDRGVRALAASPAAVRLRELTLDETRVTDAGALAIAGSRHLRHLWNLMIQHNGLSRGAVKRLSDRYGKHLHAFQ